MDGATGVFEITVRQWLRGRAFLVRDADDFVIICEHESDARRIFEALPSRFHEHGLDALCKRIPHSFRPRGSLHLAPHVTNPCR